VSRRTAATTNAGSALPLEAAAYRMDWKKIQSNEKRKTKQRKEKRPEN